MTKEQTEACWKDRSNWRWWGYVCKSDPRVVVPKRIKCMGWTMNFTHPKAIPVMLLILAIILVPVWGLSAMGAKPLTVFTTGAVAIIAIYVLCVHLSSRTE